MAALIAAERFFRRWLSKHGCFEVEMLHAATHAVTSAYLSIACALSETVFSVATGSREDSMSLFGVAIMSAVDLTGSLLVLYRWRFMSQSYSKTQIQRVEVYFAAAIGALMGLLGITLFQTSVIKLIVHDTPRHVGSGVVVGLYGAITSFVLFFYKHRVGRVLQSLVVLADAKCSLCVCLVSLAVAVALLLQHKMWWCDGAVGALVACYVMHEAYTSLKATIQELRGLADESEGMGLMAMAFKTASSGSFHEPEDTGEEEEEDHEALIKFDTLDKQRPGVEFHI